MVLELYVTVVARLGGVVVTATGNGAPLYTWVRLLSCAIAVELYGACGT